MTEEVGVTFREIKKDHVFHFAQHELKKNERKIDAEEVKKHKNN